MRARFAILLAAATMAACADDGVTPRDQLEPPWEVSGLPLTIGSVWTHDLSLDVTYTYEDGRDAQAPKHLTASAVRQITGTETVDGRDYVIETFTASADGGTPTVLWRRFRQEQDGYYQADVGNRVAPGEIPDDSQIDDLAWLEFPLAAGNTWQLRDGSDGAVLTVEAQDTLALAIGDTPAWRIRVDYANTGPNDYLRLWYGPEGMLRREVHTELKATDGSSGVTIYIVTNDVEQLVSLQLVE